MFLKVREAPWQGGKSLGSRPHAPSSLQAFVHTGLSVRAALSVFRSHACRDLVTQCKCLLCREGFSRPQLELVATHSHPLVLLSPVALISVDPDGFPSLDGPRVSALTLHSGGVPYRCAE